LRKIPMKKREALRRNTYTLEIRLCYLYDLYSFDMVKLEKISDRFRISSVNAYFRKSIIFSEI
jgi:hypothetical protein